MKNLLMTLMILVLGACGNKVEVPKSIEVKVPETTQTVNVVHTFAISLEMQELFEKNCTDRIDAIVPKPPEPLRSEAIRACVQEETNKFIKSILDLINEGQNGSSGN